ncbi:MAG: glucosamine-6-phosphate deaminase [Cyanobacteriota bacterium]|nr:glucosamine-6-phosphate deaminase [Cyanobacteriota bacterium]
MSSPERPSAPLDLIALPDAEAVAEQVAAQVLHQRRRQPERPLGLATGRTMEPIYQAMVQQLGQLPWAEHERLRERWLSFNLDEYVGLAPADPRSFTAHMRHTLVDPLGIDPSQALLPDGLAADPQAEASRYAAALEAAGGLGLQILGLGLNGHVGFNEPPCGADAPCRALELSASTRHQNAAAFGGDAEAVPARAITLGLREILAAERILLVVTGTAKAPILRRLLEEPPSADLPASWLRSHGAVTVIADQAALAS